MPQRPLLESQHIVVWQTEVQQAVGVVTVGRVVTTDDTETTLLTLPLLADYTYLIEVKVFARRTGGASGTAQDGAGYVLRGCYKTVAGVATLIGSVDAAFVAESQAGLAATLDVSSNVVRVRVTGIVDNNITWNAQAYSWKVNQ